MGWRSMILAALASATMAAEPHQPLTTPQSEPAAEESVLVLDDEQRAALIVGLLLDRRNAEADTAKVDEQLETFAILGRLPASATREQQAAAYLESLLAFHFENGKKVALAKAEQTYTAGWQRSLSGP